MKNIVDQIDQLDREWGQESSTLSFDAVRYNELHVAKVVLKKDLESKWRQNSRISWLQLGDKNTKFFHVCASMRRNSNFMGAVLDGSRMVDDPNDIKETVAGHFKRLCAGGRKMTQNVASELLTTRGS